MSGGLPSNDEAFTPLAEGLGGPMDFSLDPPGPDGTPDDGGGALEPGAGLDSPVAEVPQFVRRAQKTRQEREEEAAARKEKKKHVKDEYTEALRALAVHTGVYQCVIGRRTPLRYGRHKVNGMLDRSDTVLTREEIEEVHGGGTYEVVLTGPDPDRPDEKMQRAFTVVIDGPPKTFRKDNAVVFIADEDEKHAATIRALGGAGGQNNSNVATEVLNGIMPLMSRMMDVATRPPPAPAAAAPAAAPNTMDFELRKLQIENERHERELAARAAEAKAQREHEERMKERDRADAKAREERDQAVALRKLEVEAQIAAQKLAAEQAEARANREHQERLALLEKDKEEKAEARRQQEAQMQMFQNAMREQQQQTNAILEKVAAQKEKDPVEEMQRMRTMMEMSREMFGPPKEKEKEVPTKSLAESMSEIFQVGAQTVERVLVQRMKMESASKPQSGVKMLTQPEQPVHQLPAAAPAAAAAPPPPRTTTRAPGDDFFNTLTLLPPDADLPDQFRNLAENVEKALQAGRNNPGELNRRLVERYPENVRVTLKEASDEMLIATLEKEAPEDSKLRSPDGMRTLRVMRRLL